MLALFYSFILFIASALAFPVFHWPRQETVSNVVCTDPDTYVTLSLISSYRRTYYAQAT